VTYVGRVPYSWGGATPQGWDCSGFATWLLHHDFGISLPSNTHTVTGQFLLWTGATTVPKGQEQPGDLVIWPIQALFPDGHMGIVISPGRMVAAADPKQGTINDTYQTGFPVFRRPNAYTASSGTIV
jgi:peptidoglycan DL-endopeptidase CwlO